MDRLDEAYRNWIADVCYECGGYGDDYYEDENGDMVSACDECWVTMWEDEDD